MELRHLRYFVAVAECGGFVRAAERLHIAQPALSRQIRDLEEELEGDLFERTAHGVKLTQSGGCLLEEARRILAAVERTRSLVRLTHSGAVGSLSIGIVESYVWHETITSGIQRFHSLSPDVALSVNLMFSSDQIAAVRDGRLSAGFVFHRPPECEDLDMVKVLSNKAVLAIPKSSRFAANPPKRLADLRDEDFVFFPRSVNPRYYDKLMQECNDQGLAPRIVQWGNNDSSNLGLVAAGLGCSFVPAFVRKQLPANVVLLPMKDLNVVSTMELVWLRENRHPVLKNFVQVFRRMPQSERS
jgi:DNA-binding transcriptional LysR family regulator